MANLFCRSGLRHLHLHPPLMMMMMMMMRRKRQRRQRRVLPPPLSPPQLPRSNPRSASFA